MDFDKKKLFSELDEDIKKHAKKNDKKKKLKKDSKDPFGYGFNPDDFDKKKKKKDTDKKKDKKSDKESKEKKDKKVKPEKDYQKVTLGDSKLAKKVLKKIKSKELQESFKKDKVLIDTKKFWTKD